MTRLARLIDTASLPWQPFDNADLALTLSESGTRVFPCDPVTKRPYVKWQADETGDTPTVGRWWRRWPDAMPGVDLAANRLVVIDADGGEEGRAVWEAFAAEHGGLPEGTPVVITPTEGAHYFFRLPDGVEHGNSRGSLPPKSELQVDVRGTTGGYVIAAGAVRPDGTYHPVGLDNFAWRDAPMIPDWLLDMLRTKDRPADAAAQAQRALAIPPSLYEHPRYLAWRDAAFADEINGVSTCPAGSRNSQLNNAAFSIGTLVGGGHIDEGTAVAALKDAAHQNGSVRDDGLPQCRKTIASGLRAGKRDPRPVPDDILQEIADIAAGRAIVRNLVEGKGGVISDADTGEVLHDPEEARQTAIASNAFPEHLTYVPGLLGEIVDWITASARKPSRTMALAAAVAVMGTTLARCWSGPTKAGTHTYMLTLAPTGAGKDHALQQIRRIMLSTNLKNAIGGNDYSATSAIQVAVVKNPILLSTMDEIGVFLRRINSKRAGGFEQGISGLLRTLWGLNYNSTTTTGTVGRPAEIIHAPALSLFGVSTHAEFFKGLDSADLSNGFLNRFLMFVIETRPEDVEPTVDDSKVPAHIIEGINARFGKGALLTIKGPMAQAGTEIVPTIIPWADDHAYTLHRRHKKEIEILGDRNEDAVAFFSRAPEIAVRLATVRASGRNALKPSISSDDMQWGIDVATWSAGTMMRMAGLYMAENDNQAAANRIIRIITNAGGRATMRTIKQKLRHTIERRKLEDLLSLMQDSGTFRIEIDEAPATGNTGAKWCVLEPEK